MVFPATPGALLARLESVEATGFPGPAQIPSLTANRLKLHGKLGYLRLDGERRIA
jgi:hypothetical protein